MFSGGWSEFHALDPEQEALFQKTMTMIGVHYQPFAVSTQTVNGTNYKYLCNATAMTDPLRPYLAQVEIYESPKGEAIISSITQPG